MKRTERWSKVFAIAKEMYYKYEKEKKEERKKWGSVQSCTPTSVVNKK